MSESTTGEAPEQAGGLRKVVRGFLALSVATALGQLIGFAVLVLVARRVGPENLGAYTFAFSFAAYFQIPIDFGVTMYAIREIARHPDRLRTIVAEVTAIQLALLTACIVVTLLAAPVLLPDPDARAILPIVLAAWIPAALSLDWAMRALERMGTVAAWRLAGQVVYGALAPLLIGAGLAGVKTYAWLNVLGAAVTAIGISVMLLRAHGLPRVRLGIRALGRRYRRSALVGLSLAIVMGYYQADTLILGYLKDAHDVGIFGVAYKIPLNVVVVGTIWLQAAYPHASALTARAPGRFLAQLGQAASVSAALAIAVAAGGTVLASQLMVGLFGGAYADAATPFTLLIWSAAIALVQVHFSNAVLALGADRRYLIGVVCAFGVNVGLDLLLIPSMGPSGGGVATIAAELFVLFYMLRRVTATLGRPTFEWSRIVRGAAAAAVMAAALVPLRDMLGVWSCLAAGAVVYALAAVAFGVLRPAELRTLMRRGGDAEAAG